MNGSAAADVRSSAPGGNGTNTWSWASLGRCAYFLLMRQHTIGSWRHALASDLVAALRRMRRRPVQIF